MKAQPAELSRLVWMPRKGSATPRPVAGSQPKITANTMISIRPTQKEGSEKPKIEPAMMVRDAGCSGLRPENMPSGSPITMAMSSATKASSMVAGMRLRMSWMAGSPCTKEWPRSPLATPLRKYQNCSQMGLSSPSEAAVASMAC